MNRCRCKNCGYPQLQFIKSGWKCPACDTVFQEDTLPSEAAIQLSNAFSQLNIQEFATAEELFAGIIDKYPRSSDAYWGLVCARYGIKYEEDFNGKKIPTCCFPTIESFSDDSYFKKAVKYADAETAKWYQSQADYIDRVRETYVNLVSKEPEYDVFICYKDSDEQHGVDRTEDSKEAAELYWHLKDKGYNVFYSRETLRDKLGEKYEPYIFGALQSAKIMIVFCSRIDYIESTWVKNEWRRYYKKIASGEKRSDSLIIAYNGFNPAALPGILSSSQCIYSRSKNFFYDIDAKIESLIGGDRAVKSGFDQRTKQPVSPLHKHKYVDTVVKATCVSKGYTEHRCACGESYKDGWTPLVDHDFKLVKHSDPTCTEEGIDEYNCSVCGEKRIEKKPKVPHSFGDWIEDKHPSCDNGGVKIRQCSVCGLNEESAIPRLEHVWLPPKEITLSDGQKHYVSVCELCGKEKNVKEEVFAEYNRSILEQKESERRARAAKKAKKIALFACIFAVIAIGLLVFYKTESGYRYRECSDSPRVCYSFRLGYFVKNVETVSVPSHYKEWYVTALSDKAFANRNSIKKITIPDSVELLGKDTVAGTSGGIEIEFSTSAKAGYSFAGWELDGELFTNGQGIVTDKNVMNKGGRLSPRFVALDNTITFDGNGETSGEMADQILKTDTAEKLSVNVFSKYGYSFEGWSLTPDGAVVYNDGSEFHMSANGSVTLYAVWKIKECKIHYDGNGADEQYEEIDDYSLVFGDVTTLSYNVFDKSGYFFAGWSTSPDGDVEYYEDEEYEVGDQESVTFYAVWAKGAYSITYNLNGGTASGNKYAYDIDSETFTVNNPARAGYTFTGWTGTGIYDKTMSLSIEKGSVGNKSFTANWEANTNTLSFNANGGTGTMKSKNVKTDETVSLPSNAFVKKGYDFAGWATSANGKVAVKNAAKYTMGVQNVTLYAIWVKAVYSVTYNYYGGTATGNPEKYSIDTKTFTVNNPQRAGYTFIGWTGTELLEPSKSVTITSGSTGSIVLNANWQANDNLLSLDANDGSGTKAVKTVKTDEVIILGSEGLERTGYSHIGWSTSADGQPVYNCGSEFVMGTGDAVLYAVWSKNRYTISYDLNGGSASGNPEYYYVDTETFAVKNPVKSGYTFEGWTVNGSGLNETNLTVTRGSTGNLALSANFSANNNSIVFHACGGIGTMTDQIIRTDDSAQLKSNAFDKLGFTFEGWATSENGLVVYSDKQVYNMGTGSRYDLYAVWSLNTYTILYELNGGTVSSDNASEFTVLSASITINNPVRVGYTFEGWTGADLSSPSKSISIPTGSINNRYYIAQWSPNLNTLTMTDGTNTKLLTGYTDTLIRLPKNDFEKANSTFAGWSETVDGEICLYDQDLFYMGADSLYQLNAVFKEDTVDRTGWIAVSTPEELNAIRNNLSGKYYLTNDIDMYGYEWVPIGGNVLYHSYMAGVNQARHYLNNCYFSGIIDGNGFEILNLTVDSIDYLVEKHCGSKTYAEDRTDSVDYYEAGSGFIGLNAGTIKNLNFSNSTINLAIKTVPESISDRPRKEITVSMGIVCAINYGIIDNCRTSGRVVFDNCEISLSYDPSNYDTWTWVNGVYLGGIAGRKNIISDLPNCPGYLINSCSSVKADSLQVLNNRFLLDSGSYNNTHHFESENYLTNSTGYVIYCFSDDTLRYQQAKHHSLIKVLDCPDNRIGYAFIGWSLTDGGPVQYLPGDEIYIPYEKDNLVLYSVWKRVCEVGDVITFGTYEQDNDTTNGQEDIEWLVLAKEGDKALVISKYALDCKKYNTSEASVTWGTCSLRQWLNETFLNSAFSSKEQNSIITSTVTADSNPSYSTSPGNNTTDKVFLLSITEVNKYFSSDRARKCAPTDYAIAQGAWTSDSNKTGGRATCLWWLRSPGINNCHAAWVDYAGSVKPDVGTVNRNFVAIRPGLWINLLN